MAGQLPIGSIQTKVATFLHFVKNSLELFVFSKSISEFRHNRHLKSFRNWRLSASCSSGWALLVLPDCACSTLKTFECCSGHLPEYSFVGSSLSSQRIICQKSDIGFKIISLNLILKSPDIYLNRWKFVLVCWATVFFFKLWGHESQSKHCCNKPLCVKCTQIETQLFFHIKFLTTEGSTHRGQLTFSTAHVMLPLGVTRAEPVFPEVQ